MEDSLWILNETLPEGVFQWDKHAFNFAGGAGATPIPVSRIYLLEYGEEIRHELLPESAAVAALSKYSFTRRQRMDRDSLQRHLRDCSVVARTISVHRLVRPRSLELLPDLVRLVEGVLLSAGS
jgi:hypothetical protein